MSVEHYLAASLNVPIPEKKDVRSEAVAQRKITERCSERREGMTLRQGLCVLALASD
jgi:hypothetical protein